MTLLNVGLEGSYEVEEEVEDIKWLVTYTPYHVTNQVTVFISFWTFLQIGRQL